MCVTGVQTCALPILSFNRNRQLKKWPEVDIDYLGIIGNVIGEEYLKEKKKNDR